MVKKWTLTGIEPRNLRSRDKHLNHYTMSAAVKMVKTLENNCFSCVKSLMDMEFWLLVRDCVYRWQPLVSYHALREDH